MIDVIPSVPSKPRRRSRLWFGLVLLICASGLLIAARVPLMQGFASLLIYEDKTQSVGGMILLGGDSRLDEARSFSQENPLADILIMQRPQRRLVRLKILAPFEELERNALIEKGISGDRIGVVFVATQDEQLGTSMKRWFENNAQANLVIVCDAFDSRNIRWELDRELPRDLAKRLTVRPLTSQTYSTADWWRSRRGTMRFVRGWLGLILAIMQRGTDGKWSECNPELFQPANV